ncbi:unnamed protein product [Orchesella dallaii]|uniref:Uncharacterized protein n=1 Tax=Orchesella dallaii TaxID=48710 RepID=A0ABP1S595_9HEXA
MQPSTKPINILILDTKQIQSKSELVLKTRLLQWIKLVTKRRRQFTSYGTLEYTSAGLFTSQDLFLFLKTVRINLNSVEYLMVSTSHVVTLDLTSKKFSPNNVILTEISKSVWKLNNVQLVSRITSTFYKNEIISWKLGRPFNGAFQNKGANFISETEPHCKLNPYSFVSSSWFSNRKGNSSRHLKQFILESITAMLISVLTNSTIEYHEWATNSVFFYCIDINFKYTTYAKTLFVPILEIIPYNASENVEVSFKINPMRSLKFLSCGIPPKSFVGFEEFVNIFNLSVWLFIVVFVVITFPIIFYLVERINSTVRKTSRKRFSSNLFMQPILILLEEGTAFLSSDLDLSSLRWMLGSLLIAVTVISNAYKYDNVYNMIAPSKLVPYRHFKQLVSDHFTIYTRLGSAYGSETFSNKPLNIVQNSPHVLKRFIELTDSTVYLLYNSEVYNQVKNYNLAHDAKVNEKHVNLLKHTKLHPATIQLMINRWYLATFNRNVWYREELRVLHETLQSCNRTALILPEFEGIKMAHKLVQNISNHVFLGKDYVVREEVDVLNFRGWIPGNLLGRMKATETSGIWEWWGKVMTSSNGRLAEAYLNISDYEEIDTAVTNLTLKESYIRFDQKLRGSCIIFMLYTLTFNETVTAIYKSGFGTSDETLFFVQLPSLIQWEDHLMKFSDLSQHSPFIFHANIVFLTNDSEKIGIHCYFCPPNPTRLHFLYSTSIKSYTNLKRITQSLNANGHGRHALIKIVVTNLKTDNCLKIHKDTVLHSRNKFYQHLRKHCAPSQIVIYFVTQQALNITIIAKESDIPDNELNDFEWFVHLRFAESTLREVPNVITATRGSILLMDNVKLKLLSCVTTRSITQNVDYVFVTGVHWSVWLALLVASLSYAMISENVYLGMDTIWHLFSRSCQLTHPKKLICVYWICMIFLSCIYGSNISSESVQLQEFPSLSTLLKKGYKVWVPPKKLLSKLQRKHYKEIGVGLLSSVLGKAMVKGRNLDETFNKSMDLLYDGNGSRVVHVPEYKNLIKLIHSLTSHKLILAEPKVARHFGKAAVSEGIIHFQKTKVCKFFNRNDLSFMFSLRLWSYLSYRSSNILRRFTEIGIAIRFQKLDIDIKPNLIREVAVSATGSCVPPKPIELNSAVGVSVFGLFAFNMFVFVLTFHGTIIAFGKGILALGPHVYKWICSVLKSN